MIDWRIENHKRLSVISLSEAKQSVPEKWLTAKWNSIENDSLIPEGVKDAFKSEIQRRKNEKAFKDKNKNKGRKKKGEKKKRGRGGKKMFKLLSSTITPEMTDEEILKLEEAKLAEVVWQTWLKDEANRPPVIKSVVPKQALQSLRKVCLLLAFQKYVFLSLDRCLSKSSIMLEMQSSLGKQKTPSGQFGGS